MSFEEMCRDGDSIVPHLSPPDRLLLWAIRAWSAHHMDITGIWWALDRAFSQTGIRDALDPFDSMMCMVFGALRRWPDIRCVRCPRAGEDELRLLAIIAALQTDRRSEGLELLRDLVAPAAARKTCDYAAAVARTLQAAGLLMAPATHIEAIRPTEQMPAPDNRH